MLNGTGGYKHGAAASKTTGTQQNFASTTFTRTRRNSLHAPEIIVLSKLTRLPKFHRGEGSRHLGLYVTYFFFTLYRSDDDVTVTVSSSFMNGAREFKSQQGCKLKWKLTFFRMLKQWFAKIL